MGKKRKNSYKHLESYSEKSSDINETQSQNDPENTLRVPKGYSRSRAPVENIEIAKIIVNEIVHNLPYVSQRDTQGAKLPYGQQICPQSPEGTYVSQRDTQGAELPYGTRSVPQATELPYAPQRSAAEPPLGVPHGVEESKGSPLSKEISLDSSNLENTFDEQPEYEEIKEGFSFTKNTDINYTEEELNILKTRKNIDFLDKELEKDPETKDNSIVLPDISNMVVDDEFLDPLGSPEASEPVYVDDELLDFQESLSPKSQNFDDDEKFCENDELIPEKEYHDDVDKVYDENLSSDERIEILKNLSDEDKSRCIHNLCRISDVYINKIFIINLINLEILDMEEIMIVASFLVEGSINKSIQNTFKGEHGLGVFHNDVKIWKCIIKFYMKNRTTISSQHHIRIATWLYLNSKYEHIGLSCLNDFFNRTDIDDLEVKYRNVLFFKYKVSESKFESICSTFFINKTIGIRAKILSAQNIIKSNISQGDQRVESVLIPIMQNSTTEHEIRADIADLMINSGTENAKEIAIETIRKLGGNVFNVYKNKENIHNKKITESALIIIESLINDLSKHENREDFIKELNNNSSVDFLRNKFVDSQDDRIKMSLLRIELDRLEYGIYNLTLEAILSLILKYISENFDENHEIYSRIKEELIESHGEGGNCSSGHAFRIVNILSGYTEYSVQVAFVDQMANYFMIDLFNKMGDGDLRDEIVMELSSEHFGEKPKTRKFILNNLDEIRASLYESFKNDMSDLEFDENFSKVMIKYEVII